MSIEKPTSANPRGRAATPSLDEFFLFVSAAAALPLPPLATAPLPAIPAATRPAAVAPAPAPEAVTVPGAQVRFAALLEQYDRLIRAIVDRIGRRLGLGRDSFLSRQDIEQEVRFDLWKQVARGQTIDFPATYIYKATIRETLRGLRRHAARETVSLEDSGAENLHDAVDPFHTMAAKEQFREIILAVHCLAPERQNAVRAHLTGFGFREIMTAYGWSYQKTRNLISRGMADLRKSLNDKGEAPREMHDLLPRPRPDAAARQALAAVRRAARSRRG